MWKLESVRLSVNEHLNFLGEEILCFVEKHSDLSQLKLELRGLVNERLSAAAGLISDLYRREIIDQLQTQLDRQRHLLDGVKLHREDVPLLPVCKEEISSQQQERSHSLLFLEEPEPSYFKEERHQDFLHIPVGKDEFPPGQQERSPGVAQDGPECRQIKEEQEEQLQWPEEADWSTMTILTVKSEVKDDENMVTVPPASSPTEHMITQTDADDCDASQPTSDVQIVSSHCFEPDTEDSDGWEETREAQSPLNLVKSYTTQNVEGQRLSLSNKLFQDVKSLKQTPSMRTQIGKKSFNCTVCDKSFVLNYDLKRHMRIHTGEKPFSCKVCGKSFVLKSDLKRHMGIHTGERLFNCNICGNGFDRKSRLQEHMIIHTGGKPLYSCTVCANSFRVKDDLRLHMITHAAEKSLSCSFCGKIFSRNSNLKLHIRTHTGEKPFSCKVCGNSFSQTCHLKQHMKTHTGDKPVSCPICGNSFSRHSHMKLHMRTHTGEKPFSCAVCGTSFTLNSHLKQHMRTHTGEKPYSCAVCGNSFSVRSNLNQHMRVHTGEKPFSCTVCGKSFIQSGCLKTHMRVHFKTNNDKGAAVAQG